MMLFKASSATFLALGVGFILGAGGSILFMKYTNDRHVFGVLENLLIKIDELKYQVDSLKEVNAVKRNYSPLGSSGDEEFVDAQGGATNNSASRTRAHQRKDKSGPYDVKNPKVGESPTAHREHIDGFYDVVGGKGGDSFFLKVDTLMEGTITERKKAYKLLQDSKEKYEGNIDFHWRLSKSTFQMAETHKPQSEEKKDLLLVARDLANASLALNVNSSSAHKWYAVIVGSLTEYLGIRQQIELAYSIKYHIEQGLKLNPKDAFLHYMLGRWHYRVYMMTWMERKIAHLIFDNNPPQTSPQETLAHFMTAEKLRPMIWKENLLHIARCYAEMEKYSEAVKWLLKAKKIRRSEIDDEKTDKDIEDLLSKYISYG
ncbi:regulator of microtubule dynamics protein 1 isoform X1 [Octopus bimaculoides]|uniref:Regulator of microtubule dynamics protein 1 n=1 Tax=Octopus bimaculoides TaxID=37653 RepID=A0A0L8IEK3_OCTBM|nr:regulator of microtubule dynamics protein 1 isoform X1 [Octopus bimaculoides]|eukprot:XP_014772191.1 PREDICTED: regulator of microtubule dynamics protein 1-like isoform X1 [Octopus bimaculoides]